MIERKMEVGDLRILFSRNTEGSYEKLRSAVVGIAGAGGLGSTVAVMLARAGVGNLVIVDPDVVELSNLNRQQYFTDQLGKAKVVALKENLERINPFVRVKAHRVRLDETNTPEIFKDVDVLIEAVDQAEDKVKLFNSFAGAYPRIPIIVASGLGGYGANNKIRQRRVSKYLYMVGDFETEPDQGLMAPRVGIVACYQANLAVEMLLKKQRMKQRGVG